MIDTAQLQEQVYATGSIGNLLDHRASAHPDKPLVIWRGQGISYADMLGRADALAGELEERGLGPGSRVAIMMRNSPDWLTVWFAVIRLGAVLVPVNTQYKGTGLQYQLGDARPSLLFLDEDLIDRVSELSLDFGIDIVAVPASQAGEPGLTIADLTSPRVKRGHVSVEPATPSAILYTSGTTGPAKGCLLPHGQYLAAAFLHASACGYDEHSIVYTCLPLFHINAQNYTVLSAIAAGGTVALDDKFSASRFWERLTEVRATAFNFIGSMAASLWNQPVRPSEREHRATVAFGVPLAADIWDEWQRRFGVRVVYTYGTTENALPAIIDVRDTPVPEHLRRSSGPASPTSEVAVLDERGLAVRPGEIGEIVTRPKIASTMMIEYVGKPSATLDAFRGCWFHTGDLGYLDERGHLFYADRLKDAIRRRGEMVSSWDVEATVSRYPGIEECAMIGVPSELGEDDILVAVVASDEVDLADLVKFCDARLAPFQVPRYVRRMASLPKTQTQRVEKFRLRAEGVTADTWEAQPPSVR